MKSRRVLVFPAGTEIGLEILDALRYCKEVELFGAGAGLNNHGPLSFARYDHLPSIHDATWLEALKRLCLEREIDYIFPAYDDVLLELSAARDHVPATVLTSPHATCAVARFKSRTYAALEGVVRVPRSIERDAATKEFPVFVKPDRGQGSQGTSLARNFEELDASIRDLSDPVVSEFLPGPEYTVDCFSDRARGLLFCGARRRERIRNGISVASAPVDLPDALLIAQRISEVLEFHGAWFFQLKLASDGKPCLLEIAPRIAGAMCLHRAMGVNFPLLSIFEAERQPIRIIKNDGILRVDRSLRNRFEHSFKFCHLYIDLDDTLIVRGKLNLAALALAFQTIERGGRVTLLTRHAQDLQETLCQHRIAAVFDDIKLVGDGARKSNYINPANAIFVDDSFSERADVSEVHGIPTFDCSSLTCLLEDKG